MKLIQAVQGSPEWAAHRAKCFCASEAPAVMGASKYTSRSELLRIKASGVAPEVSEHQQRLFDKGHAAEKAAREIVQELIADDLFPVTGLWEEDERFLASLDGLTMGEDTIYEHKLASEALFAQLRAGELDPHYYWQLEHQLLVTGAERVIFVCSDGTRERFAHLEYRPVPGRREQLLAAWKQFDADLAAYTPAAAPPEAKAQPLEQLPAVLVEARGELAIHSNLDAFGVALKAFVARIPKQPTTDDEFATCDAACKALKKAEDTLDAEEARALAGLASVDAMRRAVAELKKLARDTRLASEKLVTRRKQEIKEAEVARGRAELRAHCERLNNALDAPYMPAIAEDFAGAIAGMKKFDSLKNAIDTHLAQKKVEASEVATRIQNNLRWHQANAGAHAALFPDLRQLVQQEADAFQAICQQRIAAEDKRLEAERERIRAEESARLEREAAARATAPAPTPAPSPAPVAAAPNVLPLQQRVAAPNRAPTLRLGVINERLQHCRVTAEDLAALGFYASGRDRAAVLYHEDEFPYIVTALIQHLTNVRDGEKAAA